jgi:L-fucose isomerase-like protein
MIGLFVVSSTLEAQKKIGEEIKEKLPGLFSGMNVKVFDLVTNPESGGKLADEVKDEISGCVITVASGGTQRTIRAISKQVERPVLIWANPFNNSLASALEAFSQLKQKISVKLFYSEINSKAVEEIKPFIQVCETIEKLKRCKLGCVGEPSKWPLTSENIETIRKFGPEIVKLEMKELIEQMGKVSTKNIEPILENLKKSVGEIEVAEDDIINSVKIYLAMKELISKYELSAITIKCFDLLPYNCTACVGMSFCNNEGLIAGCEADLQATLTMMVISFITDQPCWMANPCRVNKNENTITLAHCTIATNMIADSSKICLLPHMESGKGVSIRGPLKASEITLVRLGGNLDKMLIAPGKIVRSDMKEPNLCRTQVEVELKGRVDDWLTNALGNHQILVYGNLTQSLVDFCEFKGIKPIVIK